MARKHEITIRLVGPDELPTVLAVAPGLFDNAINPKQAELFLNDNANCLILAFDGQDVVGMTSATVMRHPDKEPAMFINEVGVRESHQRRGIARRMIQMMIEHARDGGIKGVWLATEPDNVAALALYRSLDGEEMNCVAFGWDDAL